MALSRVSTRHFVCLVLLLAITPFVLAQDVPTPKAEIFGGYSWYHPGGDLGTTKAPDMNKGWDGSFTWNFNRWLGVTAEMGGHYNEAINVHQFLFGPQLKYRTEQISPFVHALVGFSHVGPKVQPDDDVLTAAVGGGLDIEAHRYLSVRLFQADYIRTEYSSPGATENAWNGARLQGGLVLKLGAPPLEGPVSAACTVEPAAVMAGEPVRATVTPTGFLPKRVLSYSWTTTGGKTAGTAATTEIETTGLAPGSYTVTAKVTDNGKGKHQQTASCNAAFTINEPPKRPPTISCAAGAQTVRAGDPVTITSTATSPDNRPLTYQYTATAGKITGTEATATLDTAGAPAGPINVTCQVGDDRGLTASGSTSVNVEVPPPPPTASKINSVYFPDTKRPARVDNAAKAVLDDVALRLQREADARAVVVGNGADTKRVKNLAAQRAVNTKAYLVDEKGIDPTRIELRKSTGTGDSADIWIVPTGASFTEPDTTAVDETAAKPKGRKARR